MTAAISLIKFAFAHLIKKIVGLLQEKSFLHSPRDFYITKKFFSYIKN